jgi:hypothetical protein
MNSIKTYLNLLAKIKNSLKKLARMYGAYSRIKAKMDETQQMLCLTDGFDYVASNARLRSGKRGWSQYPGSRAV